LIDYKGLKSLFNFRSQHDLAEAHRGWVDASIKEGILIRDEKWTESVAVGSESFVRGIKNELGYRAKERRIIGGNDSFNLRESHNRPTKAISEVKTQF
jgi:putative transposase